MKQGTNAKGFPPKPWTIRRVRMDAGKDREAGEYFQGVNLVSGFTTCYYKDYDQCLAMVKDYAHSRALPWGV